MLRTVEAIVEKDGSLRILEDVELREGERALVTILGEHIPSETALLSEAALAEDWARDEETDAARAYDEAKASGGEAVPFEEAMREIERNRKVG